MAEVTQQMKENEVEKLLEAERKEEESKTMNRMLIALQKEEAEKLKRKQEEKLRIRDELLKSNETSQLYKAMRQEEEKLADLRVSNLCLT